MLLYYLDHFNHSAESSYAKGVKSNSVAVRNTGESAFLSGDPGYYGEIPIISGPPTIPNNIPNLI